MVNSMLMVGSSMAIFGNASGKSKSAMVSPISKPSMPTIAQMSPAPTLSTFTLPRPSKRYSSLILLLTILSLLLIKATC